MKIKTVIFGDVLPPTSATHCNIREKSTKTETTSKTSHGREEWGEKRRKISKNKKYVWVTVSPQRSCFGNRGGRERRVAEGEEEKNIKSVREHVGIISQRMRHSASKILKAPHAGDEKTC